MIEVNNSRLRSEKDGESFLDQWLFWKKMVFKDLFAGSRVGLLIVNSLFSLFHETFLGLAALTILPEFNTVEGRLE